MGTRFKTGWLCCALAFVLGSHLAWASTNGAASTAAGTDVAVNAAGQPAAWMPHELIVRLNHLSKRYSCDDLWYRFRDVLLQIGARPDMKILPYRCEPALGEAARSPSVQLQFQLPEVLHGKLARWADIRVVTSVVTLEPGHPESFDASDCDLLRQIKDTLFTRIDRPVSYHLACRAPTIHEPGYSLSVATLKPVSGPETRVASRTGMRR